jgi:hypothetical protein
MITLPLANYVAYVYWLVLLISSTLNEREATGRAQLASPEPEPNPDALS